MAAFATFLGLPTSGPAVDTKVLSTGSPAATDGAPHENGREYVVTKAPDDVAAPLRQWLCPRNRQLAKLLERHKLTPALPEPPPKGEKGSSKAEHGLPWLRKALAECAGT